MAGNDHDAEPSIRLPVVVLDVMHKICTELQDDKAALLDDLQALAQERFGLQALWRTIGWWGGGGVVVLLALIIYEDYRDSHVKAFRYDLVHDVMTLFDEHGTVIRQEITACRPQVQWWGGKILEYCQVFFDQQQERALHERARVIRQCQELGFPGRCEVYRRGHERERKGGDAIE